MYFFKTFLRNAKSQELLKIILVTNFDDHQNTDLLFL